MAVNARVYVPMVVTVPVIVKVAVQVCPQMAAKRVMTLYMLAQLGQRVATPMPVFPVGSMRGDDVHP